MSFAYFSSFLLHTVVLHLLVGVFVDLWLGAGGRVNGLPLKWSLMYNLPSLLWRRQLREQVTEGAGKPVCVERD